jgi:2-amino-4-hydroxy-6-hydroxymethyldihydropteridine diphosphokinase
MNDSLHDVYLGLGANLGDRAATLRAARAQLPPTVDVLRCSQLYETPPWGDLAQPSFLNAVCHGRTALAPEKLLHSLKQLERDLGRVASRRWGPRAIDLDILFYDDLTLSTPSLTIPHALLHQRAFVLVPLRELAPDLQHPLLRRSIAELAAELAAHDLPISVTNW